MSDTNRQTSTFHAILTLLVPVVLLLAAGCRDESTESLSRIDLTSFKEMAGEAVCADLRNRLYLIDGQFVFWDREGNCPDNAYSQTFFGGTVDRVLCDSYDSIAGPVTNCQDDRFRDMFDTMVANPEEPDLGLGPEHTVQLIPF